MNEADTCRKHITPKLQSAGWDRDPYFLAEQRMMGLLYEIKTHTINYHLKKIFVDNELAEDSVIRKFRITAADGKSYETGHYNPITGYLGSSNLNFHGH